MTKRNHTPGPFAAELVAGGLEIHGPNHKCLADVWSYDLEREGESQANATLFASAPLLLDDLIEAAAHLRQYEKLHRAKGTPDSLAKAEVNADLASRFEQTIAKATA
ncbi:hypothetical protein [Pseudomonas alabamensis]|uniref:hypothetical protein n=1 Tax=Pseudomonas alabamensis TaxID=3064349 RepID=UPI0011A62479